ncbi:hypothetical protein Tco_0763833, partial [Tanacetum coccineum]
MKEITDQTSPTDTPSTKIQTVADLTRNDKLRYKADIDAMNWILLGIPNDICNSIDACEDTKVMWNRVKRLMHGTDLSLQERQSRLMNEFDKFSAEAGESLESVYTRFYTLMNNKERNKLLPNKIVDIQGKSSGMLGIVAGMMEGMLGIKEIILGMMMIETKDEVGIHLDDEENDFMLMSATSDDQLEELNVSSTSVDDQLDSNIMFDDPCVEVNSEQTEHAHDAHDQKFGDFEYLIKNVQIEAENQRMVIKEMKRQNALLAKELETYKKRIQDFKNKLDRLRKANTRQPKFYNAKLPNDDKVQLNLYDTEETLKEAKISRLKMKGKMVLINYAKLNNLYDTFVPQTEFSDEQRYFSEASTSNVTTKTESPQRPKEFTKEVQEMLNVFDSMESEVDVILKKNENFQNDLDRLLEASLTVDVKNYVLFSIEQVENQKIRDEIEKISKVCKDVQANLKDVFTACHDMCVARYALTVNPRAKKALFTSLKAAKTRVLGATTIAMKSRFNVATLITVPNKVFSAEKIIMVNEIPPDHVDDVPVVEPNQHDDVPVDPEPEDKNEPKLTYPYEEVDPLNPSPSASESEPNDVNEVENPIESEDETVLASVHE